MTIHLAAVVLVLHAAAGTAAAAKAPVLREADAHVRMIDEATCEVSLALTLDLPERLVVDHRLLLYPGTTVSDVAVSGEGVTRQAERTIGTTISLPIGIDAGTRRYEVSYRVAQPQAWSHRCPMWLPDVPTDGIGRTVRVSASLPPGAELLPDTFPALTLKGPGGEADVVLGHIPAIIRVLYSRPGDRVSWIDRFSRRRLVDVAAVVFLVVAFVIRLAQRAR